MVKSVLVHLDESDYTRLLEMKGGLTWKEFLLSKGGGV